LFQPQYTHLKNKEGAIWFLKWLPVVWFHSRSNLSNSESKIWSWPVVLKFKPESETSGEFAKTRVWSHTVRVSDSLVCGGGLRICMSNVFLGDVDGAGSQITV
jgi:hypothetical protein